MCLMASPTSLPKVIWIQGRVAAGCPGRGRCSTAPWRAFTNTQAARRRKQRLSAHHGQHHFAACIWVLVEESLVFCWFLINPDVNLETEYIAKKSTNRAFNDTFVEPKCCQVFVYESETFHRRRPNGISHCENREQKPPQNLPFSLHDVKPYLVQQFLGPPHAPPQTAAPTVEAHVRREVAIGYNGAPQIRPKSTPFRGPIPKPHYLPHPRTRPTYDAKRHPDPIRRFPTMHWTDRPTDRPRESLMTIARYVSNESDAA